MTRVALRIGWLHRSNCSARPDGRSKTTGVATGPDVPMSVRVGLFRSSQENASEIESSLPSYLGHEAG
jgi:hypothetical protein